MRVDKCNKSLVLAGGADGLQSKRTTNVYSIRPLVPDPMEKLATYVSIPLHYFSIVAHIRNRIRLEASEEP